MKAMVPPDTPGMISAVPIPSLIPNKTFQCTGCPRKKSTINKNNNNNNNNDNNANNDNNNNSNTNTNNKHNHNNNSNNNN